jgi:hypothetical protein
MATEGNDITKADQINSFTVDVRNKIRDATGWYSGQGDYIAGKTDIGFPTSWLGGGKDPSGPGTGNLPAAIDASSSSWVFQELGSSIYESQKIKIR